MIRAVCLSAVVMTLLFPFTTAWSAPPPPSIPGTSWDLLGTMKGAVKKVGKIKEPASAGIFFGPLSGLAAGEFLVVSQTSRGSDVVLFGTYEELGKGKLQLTILEGLGTSLVAITEDAAGSEDRIVVVDRLDLVKIKTKAKAKTSKKGENLSVKLSTTFIATGSSDGVPGSAKGKFSFKGKGSKSSEQTPATDETEPNDSAAGAQTLIPGTSILGNIANTDSGTPIPELDNIVVQDFFEFTITTGGCFLVDVLFLSDGDVELYLFDQSGAVIAASDFPNEETCEQTGEQTGECAEGGFIQLAPGTYRVGLSAFAGTTAYDLLALQVQEGKCSS